MKRFLLPAICLILQQNSVTAQAGKPFLFETRQSTAISVSPKEKQVVHTAVALLQNDVKAVFDAELNISSQPSPKSGDVKIVAGTVGVNPEIMRLEKNKILDLSGIRGQWEAFLIRTVQADGRDVLVIAGSDPRGTAYGLLELSRRIGVSPWYDWADVKPRKAASFTFPDTVITDQPVVRYRGIFLNDEDWGLMPWATKSENKVRSHYAVLPEEKGAIGPDAYAKIFELLLRLRANTILPAMHECTTPFYWVKGNKEIAVKYGIVVSPGVMGTISATEWDDAAQGPYNYVTNKKSVLSYWTERVKELKGTEVIYGVGMRGKHDSGMQGVHSVEESKKFQEQIFHDQTGLLRRYINPDPSLVPQTFSTYKEVLDVYEAGLEIPDYMTLIWCDDNYGYITRLPGEKERRRSGGSGIYCHASYWGRPHDYLWLASTSPALIYTEMKRAYDYGVERYWTMNAGDIKPAEYLTEFFLDLAWNPGLFDHEPSVFVHLYKWLSRDFSPALAPELTAVMKEYYRLANFRKPEHTGWSRVEEPAFTAEKYGWDTEVALKNGWGGITPVYDSEYNPFFNNELNRRVEAYLSLEERVRQLKPFVPENRKSAFFELIEYPVRGASLINQKWLYAQLAHYYTDMDMALAKDYAGKSVRAYTEIERITEEYNRLENGKWRRMMDHRPRRLPVFDKPEFPVLDSLMRRVAVPGKSVDRTPSSTAGKVIARNAVQSVTIPENSKVIEGLGHSFAAIAMKQGESLSFVFDIPQAGDAKIKIATIPNHDVDGQGMKITLSADGEVIGTADYNEKDRSETWKQNVLRGQAVSVFDHRFHKAGKTTLTVEALAPHVILDQIMVDMSDGEKFYEFPVSR
ncbi:MAG: glycosyl hydrolase 115 family protein [Tannerella sp.]|nr:glycosyl hydrolase 115 family protein [Tannerella sp.]